MTENCNPNTIWTFKRLYSISNKQRFADLCNKVLFFICCVLRVSIGGLGSSFSVRQVLSSCIGKALLVIGNQRCRRPYLDIGAFIAK